MTIAMIVSIPVSIGAAIYLEEYAAPSRTTKLIQALVTNLAGVPSIVFGMFGLAIFVKQGGIGLGLGTIHSCCRINDGSYGNADYCTC